MPSRFRLHPGPLVLLFCVVLFTRTASAEAEKTFTARTVHYEVITQKSEEYSLAVGSRMESIFA